MGKLLTIKDIRALNPCYDPAKFLPKNWTGTVTDILKMKDVPAKDKLWVVVRKEFLNDVILNRFALACARQCEQYADDSDVKYCNDIVEAFLDGYATEEEVYAARYDARYAAESTAEFAAEFAARSAEFATFTSAADFAARTAAYTSAAAYAAAYAAYAAQEEQCEMLIDIIKRYSK